jgi:NADH-quinone oxidoreductase subunit E
MDIPRELSEKIDEAVSHYPVSKRSATLPVLHLLQQHFGYINGDAIDWTARRLEIEPVNVYELVTFYPGFRQTAPGKWHIRVCRTLSCAMAGSYELMERLCQLTGIDCHAMGHEHPFAVSADGRFSIEFAECLASCGTAPVCLVNDDFHEKVTPDRAEELLSNYAQ